MSRSSDAQAAAGWLAMIAVLLILAVVALAGFWLGRVTA